MTKGEINPFTQQPYSKRYYEIKKTRDTLPVCDAKAKIQKLVEKYQCVLLVGETGSGKTTQVPQYVLEMQPGKMICCTQPRRVAAMSVSARVADEMDVPLGDAVGYTIRFEDVSSDKTVVKYMTDGMMLREAMMDPLLSRYSVILLDEAHERTVATDILLGQVKDVLGRRPDLRVVVMSATLEEQKFQHFFPQAPLIHISGRMYGVEVYHSAAPESNYVEAAIRTTIQIHLYEGDGDILVFLCGEDEIETAAERIEYGIRMAQNNSPDAHQGRCACLPLYSALPPHQQKKVFQDCEPGVRKIVIATNVAETSLTIDGVVFVVDAGFAKQKVYNPKLRVESLLVTPISQAAARQRTGRAGRTKPGKCFRLYTQSAFNTLLQPQTYPEMLRCNLGSVVLHMKKMGIEDLVHFDFVDPPAPETLMRALETLNYLGALSDDGDFTAFGDRMAEFPVEPEMACMLLKSENFKCGTEISKIAAMLSVQQVFVRNYQQAALCARAKAQFDHHGGDHLSMLKCFQAYEDNNFSDAWCRENFLNHRSMKQAKNVQSQLSRIMYRLKVDMSGDDTQDMQFANHVRRAILAGYFGQVAMAQPTKGSYQTLKDGVKAIMFPSTCLTRRPSFVVYNELVLTSKNYIRTITAVSDDWLVESCPGYFDLDEFNDGIVRDAIERLVKTYKRARKEH